MSSIEERDFAIANPCGTRTLVGTRREIGTGHGQKLNLTSRFKVLRFMKI
jgi:hypothetical protein